jgi:hypothetical protein
MAVPENLDGVPFDAEGPPRYADPILDVGGVA